MPGMLVLSVIDGPDRGRVFQLPDGQPQLIGRSSEALPLTDDTVSRRHAELTPDGPRWYVRDLHSQNGTFVNGVKLTGRHTLEAGDQIRVGSTLLLFGQRGQERDQGIALLGPTELTFDIEHRLPSNDDSVVLAEPEPSAAAADHLRVIYHLTALTAQAPDQRELLEAVMQLVFDEFKPERGFIIIRGDDEQLAPVVSREGRARPELGTGRKPGVSRTIIQHVLDRSEGVLSSNAMADTRFASGDSVQAFGIRSAICSPIRFRNRLFGVIYVDSSVANYTFTAPQLALLNAIGQHTGLALANAEQTAARLQSERLAAIGQTVATLSHSIKNILQGMRGGADVVEMGLKKRNLELAQNGWPILKRNLDRIVGLTLNMLAFSRARGIELELQPIRLVIDDCVQILEPLATAKRIALIVDHDPEMPPVPIDANLIHQAVMNLLTNAIEAVEPETGAVTVRTMFKETDPLLGQGAAYAVVQVIDNGPGIPEDRRRWIFEPFNTTKGTRGTGLGLAVTRRIVEEHRGRLNLDPAMAQGAMFTISLPVDSSVDPSATANSPAPGSDPFGARA